MKRPVVDKEMELLRTIVEKKEEEKGKEVRVEEIVSKRFYK